MLFISHTKETTAPVLILTNPSSFKSKKIEEYYIQPLSEKRVISISLAYKEGKATIKEVIEPFMEELITGINEVQAKLLIVNDATYFKYLTKLKKVTHQEGTVHPCKIKDIEHIYVVYVPSFSNVYYDPDILTKINSSIQSINAWLKGEEQEDNFTINLYCRDQIEEIKDMFGYFMEQPILYLDIEGYSLNFWEAKIATFAIATCSTNACAFQCDFTEEEPFYEPNLELRALLKDFLINYKGQLVLHNCYYDLEAIIFTLFMEEDWSNHNALKDACTLLGNKTHDTRLLAYLALNSTNRVKLDLKTLAFEYLGNYGLDVNDITKLPLNDLLTYNAKDTLATAYIRDKYIRVVSMDNQMDLYNNLYKGTIPLYLEIEMTGLPLNPARVLEAEEELTSLQNKYLSDIYSSPVIIEYTDTLIQLESDKMHSKWKVKTMPLEHFSYVKFKPTSGPQVQGLLYDHMELEVLDYTKAGNPSTSAKTLKKLANTIKDQENIDCIEAILKFKELATIINTFINAFKNKVVDKGDGRVYLHSSFNQAGTVSGRLSSANVNLQNIPSTGTVHAKLIKSCIQAPKEFIFAGADYKSLEDRISALTTKDTNKLKVYTDGLDGHSYRAAYYFGHLMSGIDFNDVDSLNSIADKYPDLRQASKPITFLLTYRGTAYGLVNNVGMTEEQALEVEEAYHRLYKESDDWVNAKIAQACKDGYIDVAFGLRIRCPALKGVVSTNPKLPSRISKIIRTIANALGQSYGLLNNHAGKMLREALETSKFKYDIRLGPHIHDAQYFMVRDSSLAVKWLNEQIERVMGWQDLPEIQHPDVGLGGELDLFYPSWANAVTIPNGATEQEIVSLCENHLKNLSKST